MKNIITSILFMITFQSISQVEFGVGIFQNFGNVFSTNGSYMVPEYNLKPSSAGVSINLSKKNVDGWYPEIKIDASILSDTNYLYSGKYEPLQTQLFIDKTDDQITRDYDYALCKYKTHHQLLQLSMNRQVHKYLSVGSGVALDIRHTNFVDVRGTAVYDWDTYSGSYLFSQQNEIKLNDYNINSFNLMIPINIRGHLPIGKKSELILANTMYLPLDNRLYFQSQLMFKF